MTRRLESSALLLTGALLLGLAGSASAQIPTCGGKVICDNPLGATIRHPSSARQCEEVEVVIDSPSGHEWIYAQTNPELNALRTWTEKCGFGPGPCTSDAGGGTGSDWAPSIGYRGPLHVRYLAAAGGSSVIEFWLQYMGGSYTSYHYNTYNTRTVMTVTDAGRPRYLNLEAGDWRTPPVIPADGAATVPISVRFMDSSCRGTIGDVALRTSLGTLEGNGQSGKSIIVRTSSSGTASATLRADIVSGIATVSADAGGASTSTRVWMYGLVLSAPAELPANGTSSGIVTATLDCNGSPPPITDYLRSKITIGISTSAGTLVIPGGGAPAASVSGSPGPLGSLTASLQSTTTPRTANLRATSGGVEAFATTEFVGPKITLKATRTEYFSVSSGRGLQGNPLSGPIPFVGEANVPFRNVVEPARYGRSRVKITATLSLSSSTPSGKVLLLSSPERDSVGADFIDFPSSVTTGANGSVEFSFVTTNLWRAPVSLPRIRLKATYADDPTVSTELDIPTVDNFTALVGHYKTAFDAGPVWSDDVRAAIDRMSPGSRDFLLGVYPGVRNDLLLNRSFQNASAVIAAHRDAFAANTSPWWQWKVLSWLATTQWSSQWASTGSGADDRWQLNGLDYGPLFVEGDKHLAVVVYPRGESWQGAHAKVFDPWITQMPESYPYATWKAMLADSDFARAGSTGVNVKTEQFTPGTFNNGPSTHYPVNGGLYYGDLTLTTGPPPPWDPGAEHGFTDYFELADTLVVDCPVYVTLEDAQGRASGYAPPPAAEPTVDNIPGTVRSTLRAPDGTLHWAFSLPKDAPLTLRVRAYATGTMTMTLLRSAHGRRWVWRNVAVTAGEEATVAFTPTALRPPTLQFRGGRSVAGVTEFVAATGASDHVVVGGGTPVTIGGIAFVNGGLLQPGATVTIGGRPASGVRVLDGSTLTATVPAGAGEGPVDIVVTNPGGEQAVLPSGLHYDYARRYFAEGATSSFFDVRLALLNPTPQDADAVLQFQNAFGQVFQHTVHVPSLRRVTVDPKLLMPAGTQEFSTVIAGTQPLVVDRTMKWDVNGYGAHAETSVPAPATTWYLAEGATHSGFDLFYLLQNPNDAVARATVTFLLPAPAAPIVKSWDLAPRSRFNIWVDLIDGLGNTDVSARIDADRPIIVERAMYLNSGGRLFGAGHESAGITAPATHWFLAEGATGEFFDLFVLIANPNPTPAEVEVTYLLPDGTTIVKSHTVAATSRFNIWVDLEYGDPRLASTAVSTTVRSTNGVPIIVERAMWWPGSAATWAEAHNSPGATTTGTLWALAEGEVGGPAAIETYVLIANTSPTAGRVKVTLLFEDGTSTDKVFDVTPNSRFNVAVGAEFPGVTGRFATLVESLGPTPAALVVERAMYWNAFGEFWAAGTNALATRLR